MAHFCHYNSNGEQIPTVTEVLKIINHKGLLEWSNYIGLMRKSYTEEMDRLSEIGTALHDRIEAFYKGGEWQQLPDPNQEMTVQARFSNFLLWQKETEAKPIWIEKSLNNNRYAGTLDIVARYKNGAIGLIDFKSATKVKPQNFLQLAGYLNLIRDTDPDMYDQLTFCSVISFGGQVQVKTRSVEAMEEYCLVFEKLYMTYIAWASLLWNDWNHTKIISQSQVVPAYGKSKRDLPGRANEEIFG